MAGDFAADEPVAAAPSETPAADPGIDAAEAPAAAVESLPVLRDADDLDVFAEAMVNDPPALDEVVADCERALQSPDAEFEDADGVTVEVVVALTADGYAAVSLEDCVIVLRSPPEGPGAEG